MKVKDYLKSTNGIKIVHICKLVDASEGYGAETSYLARNVNFSTVLEYANKTINYVNLEYSKEYGIVAEIYIK